METQDVQQSAVHLHPPGANCARSATEPLTIVGWLWRDRRSVKQYTPEDANVWARMIHRHTTIPHRIVLVTDQVDADYDDLIEPIPLWEHWRALRNDRADTSRPQCYVRLFAFSDEARDILGARFVSIDLDCVVVRSLDPLLAREEDFLIYRRPPERVLDKMLVYQGSMWMMTAGARRQVWEDFKGPESVRAAKVQGYIGSDQAWIRHRLGDQEAGWSAADGVYGWYWIQRNHRYFHKPPSDARIIFFNTAQKPGDFIRRTPSAAINPSARWPQADRHQWIEEFYH
jgi:hypothetical protein